MSKFDRSALSSFEMYDWYKTTVKNHVDYKTYRKVILLWGLLATEYLLEGKDIPLYTGFKKFGIRKKYKPTFIDKLASEKAGKRVIGSNSHADFFGASVYWKTFHTRFNIKGWVFVPCRKLTRALAKVMQTPGGHRRFVEQIVFSGTAKKKQSKRFKTIR